MKGEDLRRTIVSRYDSIAGRYRGRRGSCCCADGGDAGSTAAADAGVTCRPGGATEAAATCCTGGATDAGATCCTGGATDAAGDSGLGCARLAELVELFPGETLLDLGSGPGLETIALARRVEPGLAFGLDLAPTMLKVAGENARLAGVTNVRFLHGAMESIPLADDSVDVVVSNCVVNLSPDKGLVMQEVRRVLRPGGRIAIADLVWLSPPPAWVRESADAWACCAGGALEAEEYPLLLREAGFADVRIDVLGDYHMPAPPGAATATLSMASSLVTARKPGVPQGNVEVREAQRDDLELVLRILQAAALPTAGVPEHLGSFLLACSAEGQVVGVVGLERYPSCALLRSLVVLPSWRNQGLGRRLVETRLAGLAPGTPVYLLTTGAEPYFRSLGFRAVSRDEVPPDLHASAEFAGACPQSATVMLR